MALSIELAYFISTLSFLGGLKFLSKAKKAKQGNMLAAAGMILAVLATVYSLVQGNLPLINFGVIIIALTLGTILGLRMSRKVAMTAMPQLVSLFNATGGACAFLLGIVEAKQMYSMAPWQKLLLLLGVITGAIAASGSLVAYAKLSGQLKDNRSNPVQYGSKLMFLSLVVLSALAITTWLDYSFMTYTLVITSAALIYGVLFVFPIGGADMPVVISLLNAVTGLATSFSGILYQNKIMVAGGLIVGAAGIFLTILMCKAMNRSLLKVLTGTFNKTKPSPSEQRVQQIVETNIAETALQLSLSQKVAIIPGYGLAVAQAQHLCKQLEKLLVDKGSEVHYIIHPVAGRMPGHMNVLLAEASVEYDLLKEMDDVNDSMASYDITLIIGANDVVNPAAENDANSPIYGMPIIKAYMAKNNIVLKRGSSLGYAGVQNELFETSGCKLLYGDAKNSLQEIVNQLKLI